MSTDLNTLTPAQRAALTALEQTVVNTEDAYQAAIVQKAGAQAQFDANVVAANNLAAANNALVSVLHDSVLGPATTAWNSAKSALEAFLASISA